MLPATDSRFTTVSASMLLQLSNHLSVTCYAGVYYIIVNKISAEEEYSNDQDSVSAPPLFIDLRITYIIFRFGLGLFN